MKVSKRLMEIHNIKMKLQDEALFSTNNVVRTEQENAVIIVIAKQSFPFVTERNMYLPLVSILPYRTVCLDSTLFFS